MSEIKTLDIGCGNRKTPGSTGIDKYPLEGVDHVHDLNVLPYPVADNSFDRIVIRHVIEHVDNVVGLMGEVHRIGKPGARIEIYTPHFTSSTSYADPTHRHHFSLLAFDFFCGKTFHEYVPAQAKFQMCKRNVEFWPLHDKWGFRPYHWVGLRWLASQHPVFYERFLAFLFPIKEFSVELKVDK